MKKLTILLTLLGSFLWILTLIGLPLTSFPPIISLTHSQVAPFSALPLLLLILFWLIPYLIKGGSFPLESKPLKFFILAALISSANAFFQNMPIFKGASILGQEMRAFLTLAVGCGFYFMFATWPTNFITLRKTLQWINIGGAMVLIESLIQSYFIFFRSSQFPLWISQVLSQLVLKTSNSEARVSGFTYEPSWFAHQMIIMYLPLWIATAYTRSSVFSFRIFKKVALENILLVIGLGVFFLSSSRIGILSLLLIGVFVLIKLHIALNKRLLGWSLARLPNSDYRVSAALRWGSGFILSIATMALYISIVLGLIYLGSLRDWRVALLLKNIPTGQQIMDILLIKENVWLDVSRRLAFIERVSFWISGWKIFNLHPWLGVGLGNAGFYFQQVMPSLGYSSVEVRQVLMDSSFLPNIKNFWGRLLAETGMLGFSIFLSWYYLVWRSARLVSRCQLAFPDHKKTLTFVGLMGQLALIAFIGEGFSIDSFAMPYIWVIAGLISSASTVYRHEVESPSGSNALI